MDATTKAFAELGLNTLIERRACDDEFTDGEGTGLRLTWSNDWETGRVTFTLLPAFADDDPTRRPLQWVVAMADLALLAERPAALTDRGTVSFMGMFQEAFPDREVRRPFLHVTPGLARIPESA
jgi:hypothetical protein